MEKIFITILFILVFVSSFILAQKLGERKEWLNNNCVKIGSQSASSAPTTGFTTSGNMTFGSTYIPGKTGYKCNDGLEYWE